MKECSLAGRCEKHILVCAHERKDGTDCCQAVGGETVFQSLKQRVLERGLAGTHWVTRTGCLGFCNAVGATVVVYTKNNSPRWLTEVRPSDIDKLLIP